MISDSVFWYSLKNLRPARGYPKDLRREQIKIVVRHGEATNADKEVAEKFKSKFADLMEDGCHFPQQVFSVGETGLFWNHMQRRKYMLQEIFSRSPFLRTILTIQGFLSNRKPS